MVLSVAAFYSSEYNGAPISLFQLLIVFILVVQLSVASPKVPGGIMATFTLLLNQLGLPLDAVGMLMVANVFCVNLDAALGMVIRDLDLMDIAL
jgi:Na+/H+-dicarboxylate symporter